MSHFLLKKYPLDFLDKASIIRLTISFLKLRQFSVNGHPPWAPDFTTLGSINPYSSQSLCNFTTDQQYSSNQDDSQSRPTSAAQTCVVRQQTVLTPSSTANITYNNDPSTIVTVGHPSPTVQGHSLSSVSIPPSSVAFAEQYHQASSDQERSFHVNEKTLAKNSKFSRTVNITVNQKVNQNDSQR